MSRRRAPMARRNPISRVRSVTLTSMMFITPMPPTSSDTAAAEASRVDKRARRGVGGRRDVRHVAEMEVVRLVGRQAVALAHEGAHLLRRLRHVGAVLDLQADPVDPARPDAVGAHHAPPRRPERDDRHVVLVLPHRALALARQHAHHLEGRGADADLLPHRALVAEQRFRDGGAEHRHLARAARLLGGEERALRQHPVLHGEAGPGRSPARWWTSWRCPPPPGAAGGCWPKPRPRPAPPPVSPARRPR